MIIMIYLSKAIFGNFQDKCIDTCKFSPDYFYTSSELGWQTAIWKQLFKLELLTEIDDMLLMVEKGTIDGICHTIINMQK